MRTLLPILLLTLLWSCSVPFSGSENYYDHSQLASQNKYHSSLFLYQHYIFEDVDSVIRVLREKETFAKANGLGREYDLTHQELADIMIVNGMDSMLMATVPTFLDECDRVVSNDIYQHLFAVLASGYLLSGNLHTAYLFIRQVQNELSDDDILGKAVCNHLLGEFYACQGDFLQSLDYQKLAIAQIDGQEGPDVGVIRVSFLGDLALSYIKLHQMSLASEACDRWEDAVDKCSEVDVENIILERLRINHLRTVAAFELGDVEGVHKLYNQMIALRTGNVADILNDLKLNVTLFEQIVSGDNDMALATANELVDYYDGQGSYLSALAIVRLKIVIYHNMSKHEEAYKVFGDYYSRLVYLQQLVNSNDQSEFAAIFELEKTKHAERQTKMMLLVSFVFLILVGVFLVVVVVYNSRLKAKVAILCQNIDDMVRLRESRHSVEAVSHNLVESMSPSDGKTTIKSDEQLLFSQIEELFHQTDIFSSELDRDSIARMVGSNRTYVANSIKEATGKSVSEYVNGKRLDAAVVLIKGNADMSMSDVAQAVGFQSYTTFYRLFSKAYGVTPVDYRGYVANR